jgi:hypothetical protein
MPPIHIRILGGGHPTPPGYTLFRPFGPNKKKKPPIKKPEGGIK